MTKQLSPQEIAKAVAMQSTGVSVKIGECNGQPVLHLMRRKERDSSTIPATIVDWNLHPWNTATPYPAPKEATS